MLVEDVLFVLGVVKLLCVLVVVGCWLGILICNDYVLVKLMLEVIGIGVLFDDVDIIGCDEVVFKFLLDGL